ncbi:hypothetical protein EB796_009480 [Bugula neritina]|uniref:Uncharacterized protein n=1 Tax=Bugula neritina TaxID=10212 RepID=A0A7J7K226_BUGNE|nr:hypothetical protein EB796_009480 [Bugula neritina]
MVNDHEHGAAVQHNYHLNDSRVGFASMGNTHQLGHVDDLQLGFPSMGNTLQHGHVDDLQVGFSSMGNTHQHGQSGYATLSPAAPSYTVPRW